MKWLKGRINKTGETRLLGVALKTCVSFTHVDCILSR